MLGIAQESPAPCKRSCTRRIERIRIFITLLIVYYQASDNYMKDSLARKYVEALMRRVAGTVTHVATQQPAVSLTFDDGPDPASTPALLRILSAYGAKATFFMSGVNAAAYPDVVMAVHSAGHTIGNHSWDHPSFPLISSKERREQIRKCAGVLHGNDSHIFRPPYGHQTAASQIEAWWSGYKVITWSVVLPDWEDHDGTWLADLAVNQVRAGSIILLHDGLIDSISHRQLDRQNTLDAVERILARLGSQYKFVTLPELIAHGRPVKVNWLMRPDVGFLNQLQRKVGTPRRYEVPNGQDPWFAYNR